MDICKSLGCSFKKRSEEDFCPACLRRQDLKQIHMTINQALQTEPSLSEKYPKYYKPVGEFTEIDVYAVHHLFDIQDPSGAIQHASKKLLLSGVRTGGKSKQQDIREARDTLNRWLSINPD